MMSFQRKLESICFRRGSILPSGRTAAYESYATNFWIDPCFRRVDNSSSGLETRYDHNTQLLRCFI